MVTGANTPREIKLSFRPQPLLNTRSGIDQQWCVGVSVCIDETECEGEQEVRHDEEERLREKGGEKLIYYPSMMVKWHQICGTHDLFTALDN